MSRTPSVKSDAPTYNRHAVNSVLMFRTLGRLGRSVVVVSELVVVLLVGAGTVAAQSPPTEEFNVTYGGMGMDDAFSIVETSDGGFALAGIVGSIVEIGDAWLIAHPDQS